MGSRVSQQLNGVLVHFIPGVHGVDRGLCQPFADWMRHLCWVEGRVSKYALLTGVEGDTGYTAAQEDLKFP